MVETATDLELVEALGVDHASLGRLLCQLGLQQVVLLGLTLLLQEASNVLGICTAQGLCALAHQSRLADLAVLGEAG